MAAALTPDPRTSFTVLISLVSFLTTSSAVDVVAPGSNLSSASGHVSAPQLSADGRWALFSSSAANLTAQTHVPHAVDLYLRDLQSETITLVTASRGGHGSNGQCTGFAITPDGKWAVFESSASDLVENDTNGVADVFVRELPGGAITRASVATHDGVLARVPNLRGSFNGEISADGRYVVFESDLALDARDTNLWTDIFVRDLVTGRTHLASRNNMATAAANSASSLGGLSDNGRLVVFASTGTDLLINGDARQTSDVFVYNTQSETNALVSVSRTGGFGDKSSLSPVISANGRYVAFISEASNLVQTNVPPGAALYVSDLEAKETRRVAGSTSGSASELSFSDNSRFLTFVLANVVFRYDIEADVLEQVSPAAYSEGARISGDGSRMVFLSQAVSVEPLETNGVWAVWFKDFGTGALRKISASGRDCLYPAVSSDGSIVGFESSVLNGGARENLWREAFVHNIATGVETALAPPNNSGSSTPKMGLNLVAITPTARHVLLNTHERLLPQDQNAGLDLYAFDTANREMKLVSASHATGEAVSAVAGGSVISGDGRYVAFVSYTSNIAGVDTNENADIFLRDLQTGRTVLASTNRFGTSGANGRSMNPMISDDGRFLVFVSSATDLVPDDTNNREDIFMRDNFSGEIRTTTQAPMQGVPRLLGLSPDGRYVVYRGSATEVYDSRNNQRFQVWPRPASAWPAQFAADGQRMIFSTITNSVVMYDFATGSSNVVCIECTQPALSSNGEAVAYRSGVKLVRQSVADGGLFEFGDSGGGEIEFSDVDLDHTGTTAVFTARVPGGDGRWSSQVFRSFLAPTSNTLISGAEGGSLGNDFSGNAVISRNGKVIVFQSYASNVTPDDRNNAPDIFIVRSPTGGLDTDRDGLADGWEITHFGNLERDGNDDADGDGQSDRDEFGTGTNPSENTSVFEVQTIESISDRSVILVWKAVAGKSYVIERTSKMPAEWVAIGTIVTANGNAASVRLNAEEAHHFYRVRLVD